MDTTLKHLEHWFIFQKDCLLLLKDSEDAIPDAALIADLKSDFIQSHKIVQFDHQSVYGAEINSNASLPENFELIPFKAALERLGEKWYYLSAKSFAVLNWDRNHQFCGRCGQRTVSKPDQFEKSCPACSLLFFPRISPSIIVLIQKNNQVLMARSPHFRPGFYGLIAGFVEAGENIEETVHREVFEEVGIKIKNLRYFGSQAWPFPDSLMIAFKADYDTGEINIDPNEIEEAGWYDFDKLPGRTASSISIARKLIDAFVAEQTDKVGI